MFGKGDGNAFLELCADFIGSGCKDSLNRLSAYLVYNTAEKLMVRPKVEENLRQGISVEEKPVGLLVLIKFTIFLLKTVYM